MPSLGDTEPIDIDADTIISTEVEERIVALLAAIEYANNGDEEEYDAAEVAEWELELEPLLAFRDEAQGQITYRSDAWTRGISLVNESYFETYAEEVAEEMFGADMVAAWPFTHINWEAAALSLRQDYKPVVIDGATYWYRATD